EQPLPTAVSPTNELPGYITESDLEEDSEEEDDEDTEEDPADYLMDIDDKEEEEFSRDDVVDEEEDRSEDEEEEEEHLASADSVPPLAYRTTARMFIRAQTPIPYPSEAEVDRLLAIPSSPSLPLTTYSSPVPQLPSPPLPVSSPLPISPPPLPVSPTHPLGYRAAMIRLRAKSPSTSHPLSLPPLIILPRTRASMAMIRATEPSTYILAPRSKTPSSGTRPLLPIPLPISSPPLLLPSTDCRANGLKDTDEIYGRLDDAQDDRSLMSGQLNLLRRNKRSHARMARLMESEAKASCEAWVQSMDASDTACSDVRALRTTVLAQ
ncbi:hypothetical protein Tco_1551108, partial [Tanacetum coccineum]